MLVRISQQQPLDSLPYTLYSTLQHKTIFQTLKTITVNIIYVYDTACEPRMI